MTDQTTLEREMAAEQRHLDRVYARLAELRRSAADAEREGYRLARVGNFGALVERDAMVFHAARRRHVLDAEHEGLVFGRLDLRTRQVLHVGRLGVRGERRRDRWWWTGGRRPPPPSTRPRRRSRWAWCGGARSSPRPRR